MEKELEGDPINVIMLEPTEKKKLIVHSRDNCIRTVEHTSKRQKVSLRFFGSKCREFHVKSCISPDGQYLLAGSEDGLPHLWDFATGLEYSTKQYECSFIGNITDVDWNPHYNMIAICGFAKEYPILIYVYERTSASLLEFGLISEAQREEAERYKQVENLGGNNKLNQSFGASTTPHVK